MKRDRYNKTIFIHRKSVFVRQNDTNIISSRLSKVWSILHHGSVGRVQKKMLVNTFKCFYGIILLFFIAKFVVVFFFIFIFFFFWLSIKFPQQNITNQKLELVASNCQQNCMVSRLLLFLFNLFIYLFTIFFVCDICYLKICYLFLIFSFSIGTTMKMTLFQLLLCHLSHDFIYL